MKKTVKEILKKDDWLERKKNGIGGSEIAAIMGVHPYKTAIDVYLSKVEEGNETVNNIPMRTGVLLEPLVAEIFSEETGAEIIPPPEIGLYEIYSDKDHPYILGSPDRKFKVNNELGILECKTTSINYDEVPPYWFTQLMWYLGIVNVELGAVAWLKNNREFKSTQYIFDKDQFDFMCEVAQRFWEDNVLQRIPPEISVHNKYEVTKIYKSHVKGKTIEATPDLKSELITLAKFKEVIKIIQTKTDDIEANIKLILKDGEAIVEGDNELVTWRKSADSTKFDVELFKQDNPALYKKYLKTNPASRRFMLKKNKILSSGIELDELKLNNLIAIPQKADSAKGE